MQTGYIHGRDLRFGQPLAMDVFYAYTYSTTAWLGLQAVPYLLSPKLIVTMLSIDTRKPTGPRQKSLSSSPTAS